jgi:hypothetical protein
MAADALASKIVSVVQRSTPSLTQSAYYPDFTEVAPQEQASSVVVRYASGSGEIGRAVMDQ